jgi:hypothetical protein
MHQKEKEKVQSITSLARHLRLDYTGPILVTMAEDIKRESCLPDKRWFPQETMTLQKKGSVDLLEEHCFRKNLPFEGDGCAWNDSRPMLKFFFLLFFQTFRNLVLTH